MTHSYSQLLLLSKALYGLLVCYFEFPFLLQNPSKFLLAFTLFNYIFAFLLFRKRFEGKRLVVSLGVSWFLVFVAGGSPFKLSTFVFSVFLSSTALNCPIDDQSVKQIHDLNFVKMAIRSPLSSTLMLSVLGSILGAFISSLVVILDWNVAWQKFPIPNTIGSLFGETCGLLLSLIIQAILYCMNDIE